MRENESVSVLPSSESKGLSQARLAELVSINQGHIARIELGKYSTGIDILAKIGYALGYRIDFIEN